MVKLKENHNGNFSLSGWYLPPILPGKTIWKKQRKNEVVQVKQETNTIALEIDSCAIAFTRKSVDCLVPVTVGHVPLEVSRVIFFFMERGGILEGKVYDTKCQVSPIPKGGLEIVRSLRFLKKLLPLTISMKFIKKKQTRTS